MDKNDGDYETQLLGPGSEAEEGARAAGLCNKNPGHASFIPINELTNKHLPDCFRHDREVFEFVKITADLTVRLRVPETQGGSRDEPQGGPQVGTAVGPQGEPQVEPQVGLQGEPQVGPQGESKGGLQCGPQIGPQVGPQGGSQGRSQGGSYGSVAENGGIRTGSGHIRNIEPIDSPCQCKKHNEPAHTENRKCWGLAIHTAKHVVLNEREGKMTTVDLFYDSEESRREGGGMKTLRGGKVVYSDDKIDWCWLEFTTCDPYLVAHLKKVLRRWDELRCTLRERYNKMDACYNVVWVVSHPHGISKHVTFGEVKDEEKLKSSEYDYQYSYSADTCCGSSGAGVWGVTKCKELNYSPFDYFGTRHCKGTGKNGWNTGKRGIFQCNKELSCGHYFRINLENVMKTQLLGPGPYINTIVFEGLRLAHRNNTHTVRGQTFTRGKLIKLLETKVILRDSHATIPELSVKCGLYNEISKTF